jgi:hypothetical protein
LFYDDGSGEFGPYSNDSVENYELELINIEKKKKEL